LAVTIFVVAACRKLCSREAEEPGAEARKPRPSVLRPQLLSEGVRRLLCLLKRDNDLLVPGLL
jgi:hypothetical protein